MPRSLSGLRKLPVDSPLTTRLGEPALGARAKCPSRSTRRATDPSIGRSQTSSGKRSHEGRYGEGDALPSETALAETYGVTRMTARQAMDVLKGEGLVRSEHGRGVFVRSRPTVRRLARNRFTKAWRESGGTGRGAYEVEMRQLGLEPGVELVELGPVTPPQRSPSG
jgi:hypothetical protein